MELAIGFAVGFVVCGFIANRRPQWFAKVVAAANTVDDVANQQAKKL